MLYINEWLPNPVGSDAKGEFIELYNSGAVRVSLAGYTLDDGGKKKFALDGYDIAPHGYLMLTKAETKLSLKNTDGGLLLYGPSGAIVDSASFEGAAPEGKSFSRVDYGTTATAHFVFEDPTPGARNGMGDTTVHSNEYPFGVPLNASAHWYDVAGALFGAAALITAAIIYVIVKDKEISKLVFGGNENDRA